MEETAKPLPSPIISVNLNVTCHRSAAGNVADTVDDEPGDS